MGTKESNPTVIDTVLTKAEPYIGTNTIINQSFLTAYLPITASDQKTIGMLFVGQPQSDLFVAAQQAINYTFYGSTILIILSTIPTYFFARFLEEQVSA